MSRLCLLDLDLTLQAQTYLKWQKHQVGTGRMVHRVDKLEQKSGHCQRVNRVNNYRPILWHSHHVRQRRWIPQLVFDWIIYFRSSCLFKNAPFRRFELFYRWPGGVFLPRSQNNFRLRISAHRRRWLKTIMVNADLPQGKMFYGTFEVNSLCTHSQRSSPFTSNVSCSEIYINNHDKNGKSTFTASSKDLLVSMGFNVL